MWACALALSYQMTEPNSDLTTLFTKKFNLKVKMNIHRIDPNLLKQKCHGKIIIKLPYVFYDDFSPIFSSTFSSFSPTPLLVLQICFSLSCASHFERKIQLFLDFLKEKTNFSSLQCEQEGTKKRNDVSSEMC